MRILQRAKITRHAIALSVVGIVMAALNLQSAAPASASVGCAGHCYSTARFDGSVTGIWGRWNRNYMSPEVSNDPAEFINSEMWMGLPSGNWVETGLRNGYTVNGQWNTYDGSCNCNAYSVFWGDQEPVTGPFPPIYWRHIIANVSPTGQTDTYQISRAATVNQWNIYWNGNPVGLSTVTQAWTGSRQSVGGEYSGVTSARGVADTFAMEVKYINGSGQAVSWGGPSSTTVTPGAGMWGSSPGASRWSWNKAHS